MIGKYKYILFSGILLLVIIVLIQQKAKLGGISPPMVDYKFWYIKRADDVHISEVAVRFFLGSIQTIDKTDIVTGQITSKDTYVRTQRISVFPSLFKGFSTDSQGNPVKIYTDKDFGTISTDDELRLFMNGELVKIATFKGVSTITEQTGVTLK